MDCINSKYIDHKFSDSGKNRYQKKRVAHWDRVSQKKRAPKLAAAYYHRLLQNDIFCCKTQKVYIILRPAFIIKEKYLSHCHLAYELLKTFLDVGLQIEFFGCLL